MFCPNEKPGVDELLVLVKLDVFEAPKAGAVVFVEPKAGAGLVEPNAGAGGFVVVEPPKLKPGVAAPGIICKVNNN